MSGTKKFSQLKADLYERSPESRGRVATKVAELTEELGLSDLRARMDRTQAELAALIGTTQSGISRLERQQDILVSTLGEYVAATGGRLRLVAEYAEHAYEIDLPILARRETLRPEPRGFHVVWQDIRTRQLVHVGRLQFTGDRFIFSYTPDAQLHTGFEPFPGLPDLQTTYDSEELFPFISDRLVSSAGFDFESQIDALGLSKEEATPVELLARSWGQSPHDTIQIVPEPRHEPDGAEALLFLVSGVSHAHEDREGDSPEVVTQRVASLQTGQLLEWLDEPENPSNDRAIRLEADGHLVGWIPDYLLDYAHKRRSEGYGLRVLVERANGGDRPWHLRLLCRLEVIPG